MSGTRQKILDVSLDLFSQRGYSAVSIRDICAQVSIKESSIYYHFKNKQAIFDELLCRFEEKAGALTAQLEEALKAGDLSLAENSFQTVCDHYFEEYLMDYFCNKVMRLLLIEQFSSEEARKKYDYWLFEKPLRFQCSVFSVLANSGAIKGKDCEYIAVKFYAPIYLFAQRWLFSGKLSEENRAAFRTAADRHIREFFSEIGA